MPDLPANPTKEELLNALKDQSIDAGNLIVVTGFIGEVTTAFEIGKDGKPVLGPDGAAKVAERFVNIYPVLNFAVHFRVSINSIHSFQPSQPGLTTGPYRILIKNNARIDFVQTMEVESAFLTGDITKINLIGTFGNTEDPSPILYTNFHIGVKPRDMSRQCPGGPPTPQCPPSPPINC